jgi:hypothetical protein
MSRYNFFEVVTVDGYDFPEDPQVTFGFLSTSITLLNRSGFVLEYSFDGETLHGDLNPADASIGSVFDYRIESNMWFRAADGYGDVRVESWGNSGR